MRPVAVTSALPDAGTEHADAHSFATHLVARDADLRAVQAMLAHADLGITEVDTHVSTAHVEDAYRRHPRA